MALVLLQSLTAVAVNITSSFQATGGVEPYTYSVLDGGAGGTIDSSTGLYTAPPNYVVTNPLWGYDTIQVTDSTTPTPLTASAQILVGSPLMLVCDLIQKYLGLSNGRVYVWDQKILQPTDAGIYVAVSVPSSKPFGNSNEFSTDDFGNTIQIQSMNMCDTLDIDIISRDSSARDRKPEVLMAFKSTYAEQQMEANSFHVATLSDRFLNLSQVDGAAIPYRFKVSVRLQYAYVKTTGAAYIDTFSIPSVLTNQ